MADMLSQDEIDRLLRAAGADSAPEVPDLSVDETEAVERLTRAFFAAANSALAVLLARPASASEGLGQVANIEDLDTAKSLVVAFPFRSGFSGEMAFLLRHREASMLADLILGGEGAAKDALDAADLDALKEAFTQISGSGAPTLSAAVGREVGFSPPVVAEPDAGGLSQALSWTTAFLAAGTVRVNGAFETPLRILLPVPVAREMARLCRDEAEYPASTARSGAAAPERPQPVETIRPALAPEMRNIDLILDIEVEVMVRLGGAVMPLKEIQKLRPGSIMDLDKDTDAPVELVVNDRVIAKGELVVVGSDHFALRITEIETPTERIRKLGGS
jgi:flagellar motor switch protein FliN/FliY